MDTLWTTLGRYYKHQMGLILPHEHIFVDLGPIEEENWKGAELEPVREKMVPELERARTSGVTALVECTPEGVGRRVDLVAGVSRAADFPVVVATGMYREPWVPDWAQEASLEAIRDWMIEELQEGIDDTGVRAGFIKLSAGDDGLTPVETKILRAAAQAGKATGALIGSHTIKGAVVNDQLKIIQEEGYLPEKFLWIHTQVEEDLELHLEVAGKGAWVEYDAIGSDHVEDDHFLDLISRVIKAGFEDRLLLSQDRGWYDPSQQGGGEVKPFTYLPEVFLPALERRGFSADLIAKLVKDNPWRAFSR